MEEENFDRIVFFNDFTILGDLGKESSIFVGGKMFLSLIVVLEF